MVGLEHPIRSRGWGVAMPMLLGSVLTSCAVNSSASLDPAAAASAPHGAEQRIDIAGSRLVCRARREGTLESRNLDAFMAEPSFELSLIGESIRSLG